MHNKYKLCLNLSDLVQIYMYTYTYIFIQRWALRFTAPLCHKMLPSNVCPIYHSERTREERRGGGWALYRETQTARESELLQKDRFNNRRIKQELWFCLWLTYKHIPHIKLSHMNAINIYQSVNRHRFSSSIVSAVLPVILKSLLNCSMHLWFN